MKDFYPVMAEIIKLSIGMSLIQPISTINVYRNYGKMRLEGRSASGVFCYLGSQYDRSISKWCVICFSLFFISSCFVKCKIRIPVSNENWSWLNAENRPYKITVEIIAKNSNFLEMETNRIAKILICIYEFTLINILHQCFILCMMMSEWSKLIKMTLFVSCCSAVS